MSYINILQTKEIEVVEVVDANHTLSLTDKFKVIEFDNGVSSYTLSFLVASIAVGAWVEVRKTGSGDIFILPDVSITLRSKFGNTTRVKLEGGDGYSAFLEKTDSSEWLVSGSILNDPT